MSEEKVTSECNAEDVKAITKKCAETWMKRIRNFAGFLGMILPWIAHRRRNRGQSTAKHHRRRFLGNALHLSDLLPDAISDRDSYNSGNRPDLL